MSPTGTRGSVVVGIDGTGAADDALDWATAEAAARGCRLRIVHAFRPSLLVDPYGVVPPLATSPSCGPRPSRCWRRPRRGRARSPPTSR